MKVYGLLLLGAWLTLSGSRDLFGFHFSHDQLLLSCLALGAGVLLLIHEITIKIESLGLMLVAIWLLAGAATSLFKVALPSSHLLLPGIAIAAGLLLIFRK